MIDRVPALSVLLAVQLLVVVLVWVSSRGDDGVSAWLDVDTARIDGIEISDANATVVLAKEDAGWVVVDRDGLPADMDKVAGVLEKLSSAEGNWPVATTRSAQTRFEVADDAFQKRIRLEVGDETAALLFLGTSPSFRKVHARRDGADDVFAIEFSNHEASAVPSDWLDKTILAVDQPIVSVGVRGAWTLESGESGWRLADMMEDESVDQTAAAEVARKLETLRFSDVAATPGDAAKPRFVLDVVTAEGERELRFYREGDEGDYVLVVSDRAGHFTIAEYVAEPLNLDRASLLGNEEQAVTAADEDATGGDGGELVEEGT